MELKKLSVLLSYGFINKPNYSSALQELEDLTEQIEQTIKSNRTLGSLVNEANVDSNAEFGVTDRGGTFLQTALLQLTTKNWGVTIEKTEI
ncbi:hypothetical protein F6Y03_30615 [Bacillus megaterium]|nr:hypothetical protein [Priestia megaterium]